MGSEMCIRDRVMPVVSLTLLDGERLEFPVGGGEVTRQTRQIFSDYVEAHISRSTRRMPSPNPGLRVSENVWHPPA